MAGAQSTTFLRLSLGIDQAAQSNPRASAYTYTGWGQAVGLDLARQRPRSSLELTTLVEGGGLHSEATGNDGTRVVLRAGTRWLRAVGAPGATSWMVGPDLSLLADVAQIQFKRSGFSDEFGYGLIGLAPALRTGRNLRGGRLTNDFAFTTFGFIDSPWANLKAHPHHLDLKFVGPSSLLAFDEALSYCIACDRSRSLTWTWRLSILRYADAGDTRRFARQSLSVTANMPIRRSR
jgi:hypothetical protein